MDRVIIQPDTPVDTALAAATAEAKVLASTATAVAPVRPDHIPEKFWKDGAVDTEGLAKSYSELEKKSSTAPAKQAETLTPEAKAAADKAAADALAAKPADLASDKAFTPFFDEYAKDGKLSDESFKALEAKGLPRAVVDQYIAGIQASQDAAAAKVYESVGGQEAYTKMIAWAGGLPAAEVAAFNDAVSSGDSAKLGLAVSGLNAKFVAAEGRQARLTHGGGSGGTVKAFRSTAEVTAAMSDPRYKSDPAYRDEVAQRIGASDVL